MNNQEHIVLYEGYDTNGNELSVVSNLVLNTRETKIVLFLLKVLKENIDTIENKEYTIEMTVKDIRDCLMSENPGVYNPGLYVAVANSVDKLMELQVIVTRGSSSEFIKPFSYCKYEKGFIIFVINKSIMNYLTDFINEYIPQSILQNSKNMHSLYSIRMYIALNKLLSDEEIPKCNNFKEICFTLDKFKLFIGCDYKIVRNINKRICSDNMELVSRYTDYYDFFKFLVEPVCREINSDTDIELEICKESRIVAATSTTNQKNIVLRFKRKDGSIMKRNELHIITDPKGELHNMVEEAAAKHGYTIKVIDLESAEMTFFGADHIEEIYQMEQLMKELAQMPNAQDAFEKVNSLTEPQKEVLLKLYVAQPHKGKRGCGIV